MTWKRKTKYSMPCENISLLYSKSTSSRVPVLEDISFVYLVPNTPDIFITDKGQASYYPLSLFSITLTEQWMIRKLSSFGRLT